MAASSDIPPSVSAGSTAHRKRGAAFAVLAFLALLLSPALLYAQPERDLAGALGLLEQGSASEVQEMLPHLITRNQNSPDMLYLQARLEPDGLDALKLYESILENFPSSGYADEALYHLYQYDVATGLYQSASASLERLKTGYPGSPLLAALDEVIIPDAGRDAVSPPVASRGRERREETALEERSGDAPQVSGRYALQVGAFSTTANAEKQKNFFEKRGYHVVVSSRVMAKKGLYLVWVGSYRTPDEAKRESVKIRSQYKIASMVIER